MLLSENVSDIGESVGDKVDFILLEKLNCIKLKMRVSGFKTFTGYRTDTVRYLK